MAGTACPLRRVFTVARSFDRYRSYATGQQFGEIRERARRLRGLKIVDLSPTADSEPASDLLGSLQPAFSGLGLDAQWYSLCPDPPFFAFVRALTDALWGGPTHLDLAKFDCFRSTSEACAREIDRLKPDILVVHGLGPLGVGQFLQTRPASLIWRAHLDLFDPEPSALAAIRPYLRSYDVLLLETLASQLPSVPHARQQFVPGAVDPLALRNQLIDRNAARARLPHLGIDPGRPLMCQVARLDPWKNPLGVVDAFRLARGEIPSLQLALVNTIKASEDPVVQKTVDEVRSTIAADPDIHLFASADQIRPLDVDAVQSAAEVNVLLAIREGWGLPLTEAMWKHAAVVASCRPGPQAQIDDGENGYLVDSVTAGAERVVELVRDRQRAVALGNRAHQTVKDHFLLPRLVNDYLGIFEDSLAKTTRRAA